MYTKDEDHHQSFMDHMINREQENGFTRKRVANPISYPLPKSMGSTNYGVSFAKYNSVKPAKVHNVEIEANKIITKVREKNGFKQNA